MNEESVSVGTFDVSVTGYADGIWNLTLTEPDGGESEKVAVPGVVAERICAFAGVDFPDPDPEPPTRMG